MALLVIPKNTSEAPNREIDLAYTKAKIDAGANYIVTQMFFDNQKYFDYVDACRAAGITVPIVAGVKTLTKQYQLNSIPRLFHIDMPSDLVNAINNAKNQEQRVEAGMEWCIAQSKELKAAGVPCLHYYTMGDSAIVRKIGEGCFLTIKCEAMAKMFNNLSTALQAFIAAQQMFFVATADIDGRVNLSPKGLDSLRVLGSDRLIWLNLTGSGNETAAHIQSVNRMTIMFLCF
ncbi:MAG: methylenetetrahydrofolate reductase [Saprospiraceae bacterium]